MTLSQTTPDRIKALVMLSRVLYQDAEILILDDVFAMLDPNECRLIVANVLKGLCKLKTVILITNSIEILYECDRIAILQNGEIEAFGNLQQLRDNHYLKEVLGIRG